MFLANIFKRPFNSNLRTVQASEAERGELIRGGVEQPTVQNYLAWRRGVLAFVVIVTTLGAGLEFYREHFEEESGIDLFEEVRKNFSLEESPDIDVEKIKEKLNEGKEALQDAAEKLPDAGEIESNLREVIEDKKPEPPKPEEKAPEKEDESETSSMFDISFTPQETSPEVEHESHVDSPDQPKTAFAKFDDIIHKVAYRLLPFAALATVIFWTRFKLSFQILLGAFGFSFLVPVVLAFSPWSWFGEAPTPLLATAPAMEKVEYVFEAVVEGAKYLAALLPTVLSLAPGVQKACLRVKTLLPQSILPGWLLVTITPFYAFFLLVLFIAINQLMSDPLFFVGMLVFIMAPLLFVVRGKVMTSPLISEEQLRQFKLTKKIVGGLTALGGILLLAFILTREVHGFRLFGFDPKTALLQPLDIVEFVLEIFGRSMFMTVLGADLIMRINLAAWRSARELEGTKAEAEYNEIMGEMERVAR